MSVLPPPVAGLPPHAHWLADRYELLDELGRGGTAVVYRARLRATGREVAVKLVEHVAEDGGAAARIAREARVAAGLRHPHIVQTLAVEEGEGATALVTEYVAGGTLRAALRAAVAAGQPWPYERVARVLRDVASALAHAHDRRVVHRDVKPENVFLEAAEGRAMLGDFGIARRLGPDALPTLAGGAAGTPSYMAPEQVTGGVEDERTDVYALGLVGWEMLAGRRPWQGETLYAVLHKQQHETLPSLVRLRPDIPAYLLAAIDGALAKDPAGRWRDGAEFLRQLTPTATQLPPLADAAGGEATGATMRFTRPRTRSGASTTRGRAAVRAIMPRLAIAVGGAVALVAMAVVLPDALPDDQPVRRTDRRTASADGGVQAAPTAEIVPSAVPVRRASAAGVRATPVGRSVPTPPRSAAVRGSARDVTPRVASRASVPAARPMTTPTPAVPASKGAARETPGSPRGTAPVRSATERAAAVRPAVARPASDRAPDSPAAERRASERPAAEKRAGERTTPERAAGERAAPERAAAERAAAERAAAERAKTAAAKAAAAKPQAERASAVRDDASASKVAVERAGATPPAADRAPSDPPAGAPPVAGSAARPPAAAGTVATTGAAKSAAGRGSGARPIASAAPSTSRAEGPAREATEAIARSRRAAARVEAAYESLLEAMRRSAGGSREPRAARTLRAERARWRAEVDAECRARRPDAADGSPALASCRAARATDRARTLEARRARFAASSNAGAGPAGGAAP